MSDVVAASFTSQNDRDSPGVVFETSVMISPNDWIILRCLNLGVKVIIHVNLVVPTLLVRNQYRIKLIG